MCIINLTVKQTAVNIVCYRSPIIKAIRQTAGKDYMKKKNSNNERTNTMNTKETAFTLLFREYERQEERSTSETAYTKALTDLATAVAYSVLKKCIDVSQNKALRQVRQSIARDTNALQQLKYASNTAYETVYNADGERVQKIADKNSKQALDTLCSECLGDGLDLVNDAIVAILEETNKARERNDTLPTAWIETPYIVRRLKKKVWIKVEDSINGWEEAETTPIQEVYKAVRRSIDNSRAVQVDPTSGYTYLDDISTDPESGIDEVIYRRFGKYADIGGAVKDFNGQEVAYTASREKAIVIDKLVEDLKLTTRQAKVLQLRQSGHGYKAIGTYMGIDSKNVSRVCKQIQAKMKTNTPELYTFAIEKGYIKE